MVVSDRAKRIFEYLKEISQARTTSVRDCSDYEEILWIKDIPSEPECYSIAWGAKREHDGEMDDDLWIEVKRKKEPPCPKIPNKCTDWIDPAVVLNSDEGFIPMPRETITILPEGNVDEDGGPEPVVLELSDHPEVQDIWIKYLEEKWEPWTEQHRRWKKIQTVYGKLFAIHQHMRRLGEEYELILGIGLLAWRTPSGKPVRRHILCGRAELHFDPNRGIFTVGSSSDGAQLTLETDMLEPRDRPTIDAERDIQSLVDEASESPWDREVIEPILRNFASSIHEKGTYTNSHEPSSPSEAPVISFAPAIVLRNRTTRSLVHTFSRIIKQLDEGTRVPQGIRRFCSIDEESSTPRGEVHVDGSISEPFEEPDDTYFPLDYNEEQFQIVDKLGSSQGILVQGPPGTGKSHTIANLICHLLACGKRVLVTSQGPRALKVLNKFFPKEVRPLCVSVLGNDSESLKHLEDSVKGIQGQYELWDDRKNLGQINEFQSQVYELKKKQAILRQKLINIRELETREHILADGAYSGTALDIAKKVADKSQLHDWFPDVIHHADDLPLSANDFRTLIDAHRKLNPSRCTLLDKKSITSANVPNVVEFKKLVRIEKQALELREKYVERHSRDSFEALTKGDKPIREIVKTALESFVRALEDTQRRGEIWVASAIKEVLADHDEPWRNLRDTTIRLLENVGDRTSKADETSISIPAELDRTQMWADAEDLLAHLEAGGSFGNVLWRPKGVKRTLYLKQNVIVNGRPCDTPQALRTLLDLLDLDRVIENLWKAWKRRAERVEGTRNEQMAVIKEHLEALQMVIALQGPLVDAKSAIGLVPDLAQPMWDNPTDVRELLKDIKVIAVEEEIRSADDVIQHHIQKIEVLAADPNSHDINHRAIQALKERNVEIWGEVLIELEQLDKDRGLMERRDELVVKLRDKAPRLARDLAETANDEIWDKRINDWQETWAWARADAWLKEFNEEHHEETLDKEWNSVSEELKDKMGKLVSAKAWKFCFERMNEEQRQSLAAWAKAIKRIGKGTGRHASKHRRAAQMHMERSRGAIPAWIMPFYRVAETVPPEPDIFDVVIVDEASQSGPEALLLMYLAKQCIIVGDDEQISPMGVGIDKDEIFRLMEQYLYDIPHKDAYGVETSLFAHAEIRFRSRIRLREHFRCMPEIIRFSNDLCYSAAPLEPLRQYPPDRIEPPLVVRYVHWGFREKNINKPEAEALVDCIVNCCKDPSYNGKSMGVISLLGNYQARVIENLLLEQLGPEEIEQRQLICGDAYAFQGDERDIIFLSLVVAPNSNFSALTKEDDKRRFNVAASRAKDQMWLFHSVRRDELETSDFRHKLLSYFLNPEKAPHLVGTPKFDSKFEEDVYWRIVDRGYRVITHYPVAGYEIDLVVEGEKERLAVECDGDKHHPPEQYEADMTQQRRLERCGWTFVRIRGGTFYRDPETALEPLWEKLGKLGIYPHQEPSDSHEPSITEQEPIESDEGDVTLPES